MTGGAVQANNLSFDVASSTIAGSAKLSVGGFASGTTTILSGAGVTGAGGSFAAGVLDMGASQVTSVATMAGYADSLTNTAAGAAVVFSNGEDNFLFIQGGSAGVDDDYIAKIDGISTGVAPTLAVNGDVATVGFSTDA